MQAIHKNILLLDDHNVIRNGLSLTLHSINPHINLYNSSTIKEAQAILSTTYIHLAIVDLSLEETHTFQFVKNLRANSSLLKIVVFSMLPKISYEKQLLKLGADRYLEKSASNEAIQEVLQDMFMEIDQFIESKKIPIVVEEDELAILSDKEREVFTYLINGETMKSICNKMNIKQTTASTYKSRVYEKLGIQNVADLIKLSERFKLL